jgi:hypothetical protein
MEDAHSLSYEELTSLFTGEHAERDFDHLLHLMFTPHVDSELRFKISNLFVDGEGRRSAESNPSSTGRVFDSSRINKNK